MDRRNGDTGAKGLGAGYLLLLLPLLCCGLPILIGLVGAGAFAAFWARGYGYAAIAAIVAAGAAVGVVRARRAAACRCAEETPATRAAAAAGQGARGAGSAR
jgi:hypothetical protein